MVAKTHVVHTARLCATFFVKERLQARPASVRQSGSVWGGPLQGEADAMRNFERMHRRHMQDDVKQVLSVASAAAPCSSSHSQLCWKSPRIELLLRVIDDFNRLLLILNRMSMRLISASTSAGASVESQLTFCMNAHMAVPSSSPGRLAAPLAAYGRAHANI